MGKCEFSCENKLFLEVTTRAAAHTTYWRVWVFVQEGRAARKMRVKVPTAAMAFLFLMTNSTYNFLSKIWLIIFFNPSLARPGWCDSVD